MILILGASSYIGRRMYRALGSSAAIATHKSTPVPGSIYFDATQMRLPEILPQGAGIRHALVLCAETRIDACKADLIRSYELNVRSTKQVIDDLITLGIKPVFMSSDQVFDGGQGNYTEDDVANPITVYGRQKLEVEHYLAGRCDNYAVMRLAKVFGTDPEDGSILSSWLRQIRRGKEILCARDQVFSPIHVDDVVAAAKAIVRLNLIGTFHISNTESLSRLEFLMKLLNCIGIGANVAECSLRDIDFLDARPLDLSMSPQKILKATGLKFRTIASCCQEFSSRI